MTLVMAKLPHAGRVKTRLCPPLTPQEAAAMQSAFLTESLNLAGDACAEAGVAPPTWCYTGGDEADARRSVTQLCIDPAVTLIAQAEGDLGDRLAAAAEASRDDAFPAAIIFLGVDTPHLPRRHLVAALRHVRDGHACIGPCEDGGFWTLGVPAGVGVRQLVSGVHWSSGHECNDVRRNATAAGVPLTDLAAFWDIDRPEDLVRLLRASDATLSQAIRCRVRDTLDPATARLLTHDAHA